MYIVNTTHLRLITTHLRLIIFKYYTFTINYYTFTKKVLLILHIYENSRVLHSMKLDNEAKITPSI